MNKKLIPKYDKDLVMTFKDYLNYKWDKNDFLLWEHNDDEYLYLFPLGRDKRAKDIIYKVDFDETKNILCYCNFSINTKKIKSESQITKNINRKKVYNNLKDRDFILFEHLKKRPWLENGEEYLLPLETYFQRVANSKFIISPEGNGIDCFRTWDALYLKAIPVVQDSFFMDAYRKLPILFTKNYSEITEEYLNEKYNEMLETKYDFNLLKKDFWIKRTISTFIYYLKNEPELKNKSILLEIRKFIGENF